MRTLIFLCLLANMLCQGLSAQEVRIVMNPDSTYSRILVTEEQKIGVPKEADLDIKELAQIDSAGLLTKTLKQRGMFFVFDSHPPFLHPKFNRSDWTYRMVGRYVTIDKTTLYAVDAPMTMVWIMAAIWLISLTIFVIYAKSRLWASVGLAILMLCVGTAPHIQPWWVVAVGSAVIGMVTGFRSQRYIMIFGAMPAPISCLGLFMVATGWANRTIEGGAALIATIGVMTIIALLLRVLLIDRKGRKKQVTQAGDITYA